MNTLAAVPDFDSDLFGSEIFTAYFDAREHEVYFHSLRHIDDRRNFYPKIVAAIAELYAFCDDATNLGQLDAFIFRHRKKLENVNEDLRILDYLKKTNLRGVELLDLAGTLTFDLLKAAYRKAAKKHHPDVGGSNEAMKEVNSAYQEFHDVISQWKEVPTAEKVTDGTLAPTIGHLEFEIGSASEYLNWLGAILASVHTDSWAVDRACGCRSLWRYWPSWRWHWSKTAACRSTILLPIWN